MGTDRPHRRSHITGEDGERPRLLHLGHGLGAGRVGRGAVRTGVPRLGDGGGLQMPGMAAGGQFAVAMGEMVAVAEDRHEADAQ